MASLKKESFYYDWRSKQVNHQNITIGLEEVRKKYSNKLHGLLTRCLKVNPEERLPFKDFFHLAVSNSSIRLNFK